MTATKGVWEFLRLSPVFSAQWQTFINHWKTLAEIPASTPLSDDISKDMKKRGFKFFGTTICYAHLQATGYGNDHLTDCFRHPLNQKKKTRKQK